MFIIGFSEPGRRTTAIMTWPAHSSVRQGAPSTVCRDASSTPGSQTTRRGTPSRRHAAADASRARHQSAGHLKDDKITSARLGAPTTVDGHVARAGRAPSVSLRIRRGRRQVRGWRLVRGGGDAARGDHL